MNLSSLNTLFPTRLCRRFGICLPLTLAAFFLAGPPAGAATVDFSNYCADNTGVTDCSAAFALAEAAAQGGTIVIHSGTYRLNNVVVHGTTNVRGDSRGSTILRGDLGSAAVLKLGVAALNQQWSGKISNLKVLRATGTLPGGTVGISVEHVGYGVIEDVEVARHDVGIKTIYSNSLGLTLNRVLVNNAKTHVWLKDIAEVFIDKCNFGINGGESIAPDVLVLIDGTTNDVRVQHSQFIPRIANSAAAFKWVNTPCSPQPGFCNPGYFRFDDINLELVQVGFQSDGTAQAINDLTITNSRLGVPGKLFDFNAGTALGSIRIMDNGNMKTTTASVLSGATKSLFSGNFVSGALTFAGGDWIVSNNTFTTTSTYSGFFTSLVLTDNALVYDGTSPIQLNVTGIGRISMWGNTADFGPQPTSIIPGSATVAGDLNVGGYVQTVDGLPFSVKRFTGSLNGSGAAGIAHGIHAGYAKIMLIQAFYRGNSGEMLSMTTNYVDGVNFVISGGAPGADYRASLIYTTTDDPNW
jgi:hypothetical protein